MIVTILGIILLIFPFVFAGFFVDKKKGFIYILFFLLLFQTVLGLLTQALGIFYYNVIFGCTLAADFILFLAFVKLKFKDKKNFYFNFKNIDWVIIAVAVISVLSLYQVHYNYTGQISLATDTTPIYHNVKNEVYPYPYFSDEWYAVSLVQGTINNHSLPIRNILDNTFVLDLEIFFHSFISQIMLFLGLNPLLFYTVLSIFLNSLIILLIYLFLRINNVSKLASGICSLTALYIACSGNLPGIWHLIPFSTGIIFFLIGISFMELKSSKAAILAFCTALLFYLPLIPFLTVGLSVFLISKISTSKEKLFKIISETVVFLFFALPVAYILLMISPLRGTVNYIFSRIFFVSLTDPFIVQLSFYRVMPVLAIFLAIPGLYFLCKNKKWVLLSELIFGAILWLIYSFTTTRFFIEYERVVIFTSVIAVIISGFGLKQIEGYVKIKFKKNGSNIIKTAEIIALSVFLIMVPFYTQSDNWKNFVLIDSANGAVAYPKSPANNYLTLDDLRIFKNIKNKIFLSIPWKGTVIGVATGNYPVLVKDGNIMMGTQNMLDNFLNSDCKAKEDEVKKLNLNYIYIYEFNCPEFKEIDKSSEGFVLYKTDFNSSPLNNKNLSSKYFFTEGFKMIPY